MEGTGIFKKNPVNIAHLPTLMLAIGYPIYWAELVESQADGKTSPWAAILFVAFAVFVLWRERRVLAAGARDFSSWLTQADVVTKISAGAVLFLAAIIIVCSFQASLLPPHLMQESDAMNYHYSLTRQHLIRGSFERIAWSGFDLFFMPVDFALAPYWFATVLPNKMPQWIFFVGLMAVLVSLTRRLSRDWSAVVLVLAFFLGAHGFGIQMGTAMLDLINTYLFLAALDSFVKRARWLFILEANFYLWSKSFVPLSVMCLVVAAGLLVWVFYKRGFKPQIDFMNPLTTQQIAEGRHFLWSCRHGLWLTALVVGGPFVVKSLLYAGTPLYPFAFGAMPHPFVAENSVAWTSLKAVAQYVELSVRNNYGYGRSVMDLLSHFWLIAVPDKGVNNAFDYPLGLTYLLALGPFVVFTIEALRNRRLPLGPMVIAIMWALWWAGSQQSRWLYVPLLLMFVVTAVRLRPSKILWMAIILALTMNTASIIRAHKGGWGKQPIQVLREQDRRLVDLSAVYLRDRPGTALELEEYEVAFAQFPVIVRKESLPNAIAF